MNLIISDILKPIADDNGYQLSTSVSENIFTITNGYIDVYLKLHKTNLDNKHLLSIEEINYKTSHCEKSRITGIYKYLFMKSTIVNVTTFDMDMDIHENSKNEIIENVKKMFMKIEEKLRDVVARYK